MMEKIDAEALHTLEYERHMGSSSLSEPPKKTVAQVTTRPEKPIKFEELDLFPDGLISVMPVPFEALPVQIAAWCQDVAARLGSAPDYLVAGVLTGLSSMLGRKVLLKPKAQDDWLVTPNLWGAMVGRPSTKKTPSELAALSFLEKKDAELRRDNTERQKDYQAEMQFLKITENEVKKTIKNLSKSEAISIIRENHAENSPSPLIKRAVVHNATVEKLIMLLSDNPNGLLVVRDEISGLLQSLDRNENAEAREFYLLGFNGNVAYSHDRVSRESVYVEHCILSVFGGIQPSKIKPYLSAMKSGKSDDGLVQRFQVLVFPDPVIELGKDTHPKAEHQAQLDKIFRYFESLPENGEPKILSFTPEAQNLFYQWQLENIEKCRAELSPSIESLLSKHPAFVASLALIIHLAEGQQLTPVSHNPLLKAIGLAEYFESHARRLYSLVDTPDYSARSLAEHLTGMESPFKPADFRKKDWSGLTASSDRKKALSTLVSRGYLAEEIVMVKNSTRSIKIYHINPLLKEEENF